MEMDALKVHETSQLVAQLTRFHLLLLSRFVLLCAKPCVMGRDKECTSSSSSSSGAFSVWLERNENE